jgi:hypothetical protein
MVLRDEIRLAVAGSADAHLHPATSGPVA